MKQARKKENIENVRRRVAKYRNKPNFDRLEIASISPDLKKDFLSLPGISYAEKLKAVIDAWKLNNSQSVTTLVNNKSTITSPENSKPVKSKKAVEAFKIKDWSKFEQDFNNFLFDFRLSNQTRANLRKHGKQVREALENNPEFEKAFNKICEKLPDKILKLFKPMYRQGYFYLYSREIIEIASQESTDKILLILLESLRYMGKIDPIKEAKKALGFKA